MSHLRKAVMNTLVKMVNPVELETLVEEFKKIDKDNSGQIEVSELKNAIKQCNFTEISDEELDQIIGQLDYDGNGRVGYSEFISATIDLNRYLTPEKIDALFKQFDIDGDEIIQAENIKQAFTKLGQELNDRDIEAIIAQHDKDGDKNISLEEFKEMLFPASK